MMNLWWGYVHVTGSLQVKIYFDEQDLIEAKASPFVRRVFGPFPADGRAYAMMYLDKLRRGVRE